MTHKTVLVLAPHTDDGELNCGATISKFIRHGADVHYVAFSSCEESLPAHCKPGCLIEEMRAATAKLGIPAANVRCLDFQVRLFESHRQEILDSMIKLNRELRPQIILAPSIHDIHQDHAAIARESLRAFKRATLLQYEVPWNNYTFNNQLFSCVEEIDVENKIAAVHCYQSQGKRGYTNETFLRGQLITHGVQIDRPYAEVFEIPRMVIDEQMTL